MSGSSGWAEIVLSSFAPAGAGGLVAREGEVDWADAWRRFLASMNAKARLGARIGLLIAITAPLWTMGRLASIAALGAEKRARALDALLTHRVYLFRELTLMLKVCACFALFRQSEVRARTSYDRPERASSEARSERARRLPVIAEAG